MLSELGWNIWDTDRNLEEGLFIEGVMRVVMTSLDIAPSIHILDCTKIQVNLDNSNYENSKVIKDDGQTIRGYKMGTLRGLIDDSD